MESARQGRRRRRRAGGAELEVRAGHEARRQGEGRRCCLQADLPRGLTGQGGEAHRQPDLGEPARDPAVPCDDPDDRPRPVERPRAPRRDGVAPARGGRAPRLAVLPARLQLRQRLGRERRPRQRARAARRRPRWRSAACGCCSATTPPRRARGKVVPHPSALPLRLPLVRRRATAGATSFCRECGAQVAQPSGPPKRRLPVVRHGGAAAGALLQRAAGRRSPRTASASTSRRRSRRGTSPDPPPRGLGRRPARWRWRPRADSAPAARRSPRPPPLGVRLDERRQRRGRRVARAPLRRPAGTRLARVR